MKSIKKFFIFFFLFSLFTIFIKFTTIKIYLDEEPSVIVILKVDLIKKYPFSLFHGYTSIRTSSDSFYELSKNSYLIIYDENSFCGEYFYDYLVSVGWFVNILIILIFLFYKYLILKIKQKPVIF